MCEIDWNRTIEPVNKSEIEKHLTPFLWLVPRWCNKLNVNLWDSIPENDGELACVRLSYEYREMTIEFATAWLDRDEKTKTFSLVHELLHGYFGLIADYARDSFDRLCPEDEAKKFNAHLQNELRVKHESATQDLTIAIMSKYDSKRNLQN